MTHPDKILEYGLLILVVLYLSSLIDVRLTLVFFFIIVVMMTQYYSKCRVEKFQPLYTNFTTRMNELRTLGSVDLSTYEQALSDIIKFLEEYRKPGCDILAMQVHLNSAKLNLRIMASTTNNDYATKLNSLIKDLEDYYQEKVTRCSLNSANEIITTPTDIITASNIYVPPEEIIVAPPNPFLIPSLIPADNLIIDAPVAFNYYPTDVMIDPLNNDGFLYY